MGLRLVPSAHDAEGDADLPMRHKGRNDGVQRSLVPGQNIWARRIQGEQAASVLENETCGCRYDARTKRSEVALNVRDHVALGIDGAKIGRVVAHRGRLASGDL